MEKSNAKLSLIVHGGAGDIPEAERPLHRAGLERALEAGWRVLEIGGAALDAVETAVRLLEDDAAFDAGVGSVLRLDGSIAMDASIMEGSARRAGAVAGVRRVRHPISLARAVLERTRHVFMIGEGAERLAGEAGLELVDPDFFVTERERRRLERILESRAATAGGGERERATPTGTVGAVARDAHGHVAAATSTGGAPGSLPGRVGDSPIIGAGTFADDRCGGVSCTGTGEHIIRTTLARELVRRMELGTPAHDAAAWAMEHLRVETGGTGGVICLDAGGGAGSAFSTAWMGSLSRCSKTPPAGGRSVKTG